MDSTQARTEQVRSGYLNSNAMNTGLTLLAVGGVLGAFGIGISGTAMIQSFRRWLTAQQQPVRSIATNKMVPARTTPAKTTPAKTTPAKTTPAKTTLAKTAPAVGGGPKEMAPSSVAR